MTEKHPDSEIIDRLGGTAVVARIFNIKQPSVSDWRHTGIPDARRMYLRVMHPSAFTDQPAPPPAAQAVEAGHA
ncbi:hypothetical protein D0839_16300 [Bordetella avium]|uniref:hypothetical protein n=1 Tax=Bordetella avium TaxID=521 RepID=UPI000E6A3610|nr:hypothetical protein [Bordetella avium]RIQ65853.1 hypothetical protein D0839_16300 [Bordetella avium]